MIFKVILIESGRPTHHWTFTQLLAAYAKHRELNLAFEECPEVFAIFVKLRSSDQDLLPDQILQNMIVPPPME